MWNRFLLAFLLNTLVASCISPPECTDGSSAQCICGDGSEPNYSKFPPCEIKKVKGSLQKKEWSPSGWVAPQKGHFPLNLNASMHRAW